eukprot:g1030.t1
MSAKVAWILQESPTLISAIACVLLAEDDDPIHNNWMNQLLLLYFVIHYVNRTLIYPFLLRGSKPTSFLTIFAATLFCTTNGYLQCRNLTKFARYDEEWSSDFRFLFGTILFFVGMIMNNHSDHILRNLRKPGEAGYKIPRGGMFEYVSGANFLGEIVEWLGFAVATWTLSGFAFALCTVLNIGPRAIQHHAWYLEKFKDTYPKHRKALVPFVF